MLTRRTFVSGLPLAFSAAAAVRKLTEEDDQFLEDLAHRCFRFFWEQADANTGLVRDRALADTGTPDPRPWASSAATGFGLTALSIAAERGWLTRRQVRERVLSTLGYYAEKAVHEHGRFYHFVHSATGARRGTTEVSDIDTALLLAGVVAVQEYFHKDKEIGRLARTIWDRIDFRWMMNGNPTLLNMHWKPEDGFTKNYWDHHCELGIRYLRGIASATSPLPVESWHAWKRPLVSYARHTYIRGAPPLFVHQYSRAWIDFPPSPRETGTSDRTFGDRIYKRYGFVDAFHPNNGWTDPDVIVIDVGITLLSAENLRTGNVWKWFMRKRQIQRVMAELFV